MVQLIFYCGLAPHGFVRLFLFLLTGQSKVYLSLESVIEIFDIPNFSIFFAHFKQYVFEDRPSFILSLLSPLFTKCLELEEHL